MNKGKKKELNFLFINLEGTALLAALTFLVYTKVPHFKDLLGETGLNVLNYFFITYLIINFGYFIYCFIKKKHLQETKIAFLYSYLLGIFRPNKQPVDKKKLKLAIMSLLVKFFFFPIMLSFFLGRWPIVTDGIINLAKGRLNLFSDFNYLFNFLFSVIFFVDTLIFTFGYAFEAKELKSEIKSVEPTFFGWFVALICYPPFNRYSSQFLSSIPVSIFGTAANTTMLTETLNVFGASGFQLTLLRALKVLSLLMYGIYVWATLALGTKSSNLTNRGIISSGPYKFIRHPAYISKNMAWWLETFMGGLSVAGLVAMLGWNLVYYFRAKTEERHLLADPDYKRYVKKVKWMFVPGVV